MNIQWYFKGVVLVFIFLFFVGLALFNVNDLGLQYDELLFGNAALGCIDETSFINGKLGQVPILLMPYIGALKAYLYFPILKLVPASTLLIRIIPILITCGTIFLFYRSIELISNNSFFALWTTFFLAIDPNVVYWNTFDVGPNAIEFFIKMLAVLYMIKFYKEERLRYILYLIIILSLGLFNKLNFIWFINVSVLLGFIWLLVNHWNSNNDSLRRTHIIKVFFLMSIYFIAAFSYILFFVKSENDLGAFAFDYSSMKLLNKVRNLNYLLNGQSFYSYIFKATTTNLFSLLYYCFTLIILLIGGVLSLYNLKYKKDTVFTYLFLYSFLIIVCTLIQVVITKEATAPWHVFTIYPFYTVLISSSIYLMYSFFSNHIIRKGVILSVLMILCCRAVIFSNYMIGFNDITEKNKKINIHWDPAIIPLAEYCKTQDKKVGILDWGIFTQLLVLDPKKGKYSELFWSLNDEMDSVQLKSYYDDHIKGKKIVFVDYNFERTKSDGFNRVLKNFRRISEYNNHPLKIEKEINRGSKKVFIVYSLQ